MIDDAATSRRRILRGISGFLRSLLRLARGFLGTFSLLARLVCQRLRFCSLSFFVLNCTELLLAILARVFPVVSRAQAVSAAIRRPAACVGRLWAPSRWPRSIGGRPRFGTVAGNIFQALFVGRA